MGFSVMNFEAVTPSGLARHIWRALHPEEASKLLTNQQIDFILGFLSEAVEVEETELLKKSISAVRESILQDRAAGTPVAELHRQAGTNFQKAYVSVFEAYQGYLKEYDLLDSVDVMAAALDGVGAFVAQRHVGSLLVVGEPNLSFADAQLIERLGQAVRKHHVLPRKEEEPEPTHVENQPAVLVAPTRREEIRMVLVHILEQQIPFDRIEIAVSPGSPHESELLIACRRFGIPIQYPGKNTALPMQTGHIIQFFCEWILSGQSPDALVRFLREGLLRSDLLDVSAIDVATALEAFPIHPSAVYRPGFLASLYEKASSRNIRKQHLTALVHLLKRLEHHMPANFVRPEEFGTCLAAFLEEITHCEVHPDTMESYSRLLVDSRLPKSQRSWVASSILADGSKVQSAGSTGLKIVSLTEAGYGTAQRVYVPGMDDGTEDGSKSGDQSKSIVSEHHVQDPEQSSLRKRVEGLCSRLGADLVLSASTYDVAGGRPLFPNAAFIELSGDNAFVPAARDMPLDDGERDATGLYSPDRSVYSNLLRGASAYEARHSERWTAYDGVLSLEDPLERDVWSPSQLELIGQCPFKYFLRKVLKVKVPEISEEMWIDKREEGNVLHDLFEAHVKARLANKSDLSEQAEAEMLDRLSEQIIEFAAVSGISAETEIHAKIEELAHAIRLYFRKERRESSQRTPRSAEFGFGSHPDSDAPPFELSTGDSSLRLSGRVDRVDTTSDGSLVIVDYKSGSAEGYAPHDLAGMKSKMQWALYALMVAEHEHLPVEWSEYFFSSLKAGGLVSRMAPMPKEEVERLVRDLSKRYKDGAFVQAAGSSECTYCSFKDVCGDLSKRKARLKEKFEAPDGDLQGIYSNWSYSSKWIQS